jgi:hypothetical protein
MRGFAGVNTAVVLDEAMIIRRRAHSASMPIIRASENERGPNSGTQGRLWIQEIHEHGVVWAGCGSVGSPAMTKQLAYFEWSLDFEHPDDVPDGRCVAGSGAVAW